jgi:hypothetical protein
MTSPSMPPRSQTTALCEWSRVTKFDARAVAVVDGKGPFGNGIAHYSRRKPGAPQFMPPGQTIVLLASDCSAVYGWWRPDPKSGIVAMNKRDGWTCTVFRNDHAWLSSEAILAAEIALATSGYGCGPDGMLTYVFRAKVSGTNPGYCYKCAGWKKVGQSADRKKDLLAKPFALAGISPLAHLEPRAAA